MTGRTGDARESGQNPAKIRPYPANRSGSRPFEPTTTRKKASNVDKISHFRTMGITQRDPAGIRPYRAFQPKGLFQQPITSGRKATDTEKQKPY